jgi:hypothetical protein
MSKLRLKVGTHEFEAEGTSGEIHEYLSVFMVLTSSDAPEDVDDARLKDEARQLAKTLRQVREQAPDAKIVHTTLGDAIEVPNEERRPEPRVTEVTPIPPHRPRVDPRKGRLDPSTLELDEQLIQVIRTHYTSGRAIRMFDLKKTHFLGVGTYDEKLRASIKRLVSKGILRVEGSRTATKYYFTDTLKAREALGVPITQPADETPQDVPLVDVISAVAPPPPTRVEPAPLPESKPATPESKHGQCAFYLLKNVFINSQPHHVADIALDLTERFNVDYRQTMAVLDQLTNERVIQRIRKGGEMHFVLADETQESEPAPVVPSPREDTPLNAPTVPDVQDYLSHQIFTDMADYGLSAIVSKTYKDLPGSKRTTVEQALTDLVREKKLRVRTVGHERRYQRAL